ncbi:hypothetical protein SAMN05421688_2245 [Poseidonocella pacifica]|uniref:Uncharacterized protein n=1 Tax=Poseidonocella pacifica TaxID=871651 RepID=A0A1I0XGB4_9RHOB|nr:hypothetical protein [Poseidonocella pacifica]SFB00065.1 hypothetical protein SAMN05421688_2245 [Poseidonocella pacifica]
MMEVKAQERGLVRLFSVDLPEGDVEAFGRMDRGEGPLTDALGAGPIDEKYVEIFPVESLDDVGLSGYLVDGLGVPAEQLAGEKARLDGLQGHVLVLLSGAFGGREVTFAPRAPLRWIGTYAEAGTPVHFESLPAGGAAAQSGVATDAPRRASRVPVYVGIVILLLIVLGFILLGRGR